MRIFLNIVLSRDKFVLISRVVFQTSSNVFSNNRRKRGILNKSQKEEHIESCFLSLVRCINLFPFLEMRYGLLLAFSFKNLVLTGFRNNHRGYGG